MASEGGDEEEGDEDEAEEGEEGVVEDEEERGGAHDGHCCEGVGVVVTLS